MVNMTPAKQMFYIGLIYWAMSLGCIYSPSFHPSAIYAVMVVCGLSVGTGYWLYLRKQNKDHRDLFTCAVQVAGGFGQAGGATTFNIYMNGAPLPDLDFGLSFALGWLLCWGLTQKVKYHP